MSRRAPEPRSSALARRRGLSGTELVIVVFVGLLCLSLVLPVFLSHGHGKANGAKCRNNLRQIGIASLQYTDVHRFFPHLGPLGTLQGGPDSSDTPRVMRALVWEGYHDNPEGFICPSSFDMHLVRSDAAKAELKRWSWGGADAGDPTVSPLAGDGVKDPTLRETSELSYGWTRRGLSSNVRSRTPVGADRACRLGDDATTTDTPPGDLGNHVAGVSLLEADGTVTWVSAGSDAAPLLTEVDGPDAGALGIAPLKVAPDAGWADDERLTLSRGLVKAGALALALLPAALLGILFEALGRRRRRGEDASTTYATPVIRAAERTAPDGSSVRPVRPSRVETLGPDERLALTFGAPPAQDGKVTLQTEQRCPVCHDAVQREAALTRCASCRAVFHAECVVVGGDCPTLGCPG